MDDPNGPIQPVRQGDRYVFPDGSEFMVDDRDSDDEFCHVCGNALRHDGIDWICDPCYANTQAMADDLGLGAEPRRRPIEPPPGDDVCSECGDVRVPFGDTYWCENCSELQARLQRLRDLAIEVCLECAYGCDPTEMER